MPFLSHSLLIQVMIKWYYNVGVIERLKVNDIIFGLSIFEIRWHEGLHAYVYKGVEGKIVNGNAKSFFVCKIEEKF